MHISRHSSNYTTRTTTSKPSKHKQNRDLLYAPDRLHFRGDEIVPISTNSNSPTFNHKYPTTTTTTCNQTTQKTKNTNKTNNTQHTAQKYICMSIIHNIQYVTNGSFCPPPARC